MKKCIKCDEYKPFTEFRVRKYRKGTPYRNQCRACERRSRRERIYGVSDDSIREMIKAQNYRCAICREPFKATPCVDHCHTTGVVRGMLCANCNIGLAKFRDSIRMLELAVDYLTRAEDALTGEVN